MNEVLDFISHFHKISKTNDEVSKTYLMFISEQTAPDDFVAI